MESINLKIRLAFQEMLDVEPCRAPDLVCDLVVEDPLLVDQLPASGCRQQERHQGLDILRNTIAKNRRTMLVFM